MSKYHLKRYHEAITDLEVAQKKEDNLIYLKEALKESERNPGILDGFGLCYHALKNY